MKNVEIKNVGLPTISTFKPWFLSSSSSSSSLLLLLLLLLIINIICNAHFPKL